ncbi:MAG: SUMF1/EgtB/PvdO family nonheme iron enzyme [Saprospiraceae bacterium]|nr:SUMF1/EgtB/PvdO family nonheme iron enzyme [Saprospiraceae bacterium]
MLLRFTVFSWVALSACTALHNNPDHPRPIQKGLPGTIFLRDSLWLDQYELTNADWREYVGWLVRQHGTGSPEYLAALPDSAFWLTHHDLSNEPQHETYFRATRYDDYPITGISHEQAVAYCQWRTERVREAVCATPPEKTAMPQRFRYRLPSVAEWEYAATAGLNAEEHPFGYISLRDKKGHHKVVTKETLPANTDPSATFGLPRNTGSPNRYGFHNLIGNVAEMVAEQGVAKGGSYANTLEESRVKNEIRYDRAMPWLGFRCVCAVGK